jgi:hypothetical protein
VNNIASSIQSTAAAMQVGRNQNYFDDCRAHAPHPLGMGRIQIIQRREDPLLWPSMKRDHESHGARVFILRVNTPSDINVGMSWLGENVRPIDLRSMGAPALVN